MPLLSCKFKFENTSFIIPTLQNNDRANKHVKLTSSSKKLYVCDVSFVHVLPEHTLWLQAPERQHVVSGRRRLAVVARGALAQTLQTLNSLRLSPHRAASSGEEIFIHRTERTHDVRESQLVWWNFFSSNSAFSKSVFGSWKRWNIGSSYETHRRCDEAVTGSLFFALKINAFTGRTCWLF